MSRVCIYIYMYICIYVCLYEFYGLWNRDLWESCQTWEPWRWHLLRWQLKPRKMNCDRFGRWESWEGFCCKWFCLTLPETNSKSTWKWMVGTLVFFWHGMFNWGGLFFLLSPLLGEMMQFYLTSIFQLGWNHQPALYFTFQYFVYPLLCFFTDILCLSMFNPWSIVGLELISLVG